MEQEVTIGDIVFDGNMRLSIMEKPVLMNECVLKKCCKKYKKGKRCKKCPDR